MNEYKVSKMKMYEDKGNFKATASVVINDCLVINHIKVIQGPNGVFVGMPSYSDNDGKFHDKVFPVTLEDREALNKAVLSAYEQQKADIITKADKVTDVSKVKVTLNTRDTTPNVLAVANVTISGGFAIPGIRIMENSNTKEPFVVYPSDMMADGTYREIFHPITKGMKEALENAIISEYSNELNLTKQALENKKSVTQEQDIKQDEIQR